MEHHVDRLPRGHAQNLPSSSRNTDTPPKRPLTPLETAELLGVDDKTVTRWARKGYIPAHPLGEGKRKYWRFFEEELLDWLYAQTNGEVAA